jgi:hypothetical protein
VHAGLPGDEACGRVQNQYDTSPSPAGRTVNRSAGWYYWQPKRSTDRSGSQPPVSSPSPALCRGSARSPATFSCLDHPGRRWPGQPSLARPRSRGGSAPTAPGIVPDRVEACSCQTRAAFIRGHGPNVIAVTDNYRLRICRRYARPPGATWYFDGVQRSCQSSGTAPATLPYDFGSSDSSPHCNGILLALSASLRSLGLRSANLRSASLRSASLRSLGLRSANLRSANLRSVGLRSVGRFT